MKKKGGSGKGEKKVSSAIRALNLVPTAWMECELLHRAISLAEIEMNRLRSVIKQMEAKQSSRIREYNAQLHRLVKGGA